jgi:histidinol phosphatase-like enzyme
VVKYKHNGILKSYLPDFYIEYIDGTIIIEEVKGYIEDIEIFKLKKKACEKFCSENKFKYKINFMKNYEKYKHLL